MSSPDSPGTRALRVIREIGWPRLLVTVLVVLVLSTLCVIAGRWQYGRYVTKADALAAYHAAQALPPAQVEDVAPPADTARDAAAALPDGAEWRTVGVTGTIDPGSLTALRNRPVDSAAALQYLAWMHLDDGAVVLVNLGWSTVEDEQATTAALTATIPSGEVTLTGTMRAFERDDGKRGGGATRITPAQMPDPGSRHVVPGYVVAADRCALLCGTDSPLAAVPLPTLDLGPHLSYAWQWWAFSLMVPVGAWILTRRDLEMKRAAEGVVTPAPAPRPRRRRAPTDEEIEDAL
ncbi:SURF1 family protein [Demequina capsici]|uniref:SURF1-like protein n=1 Tax=Demequina capsici TaxID=3075620 RepID=A0AA96FD30_9MICO|nr:SURF1 family protein [Demequina sp. PMTSA13]WNM26105.1 SURF1 family protein [Demequina sp. PMTSA13]